ncbi:ras-related protein Rab-18A-like [Ischnura elegans]|uniref:ras-related protein Rab-18A-like n=1 Tax=Ischnura elegans TaxID=197161 RepID=UPI001ED86883|nr:ras-related protein Rab-18A-like [Ischnura elegans]
MNRAMTHQSQDSDLYTKLKIVLIGERGVGKTSILKRFTDDEFDSSRLTTIGVALKEKTVTWKRKSVKLEIYDTAGEERFRSLTPVFYRGTQGALIVFDVTDKYSFSKLDVWLNELNIFSTNPNIVRILVGNKIDKGERQVTVEECQKLAEQHQILYMETSAKTSSGVQQLFEVVVDKMLQTPGLWEKINSGRLKIGDRTPSCRPDWCNGMC